MAEILDFIEFMRHIS